MTDNTIIRIPQPRFGINEIVYFKESAILGYLEPAKVREAGYDQNISRTFYVFEFKKNPPNTQIAGDAIDLKRARRIAVYEDDVISYSEALQLKLTFLENELNKTKLLFGDDIGNPSIDISGNNDTDLLSFGSISIGNSINKQFKLINTGTSDLVITSSPVINVVGDSDFSVYKQPSSFISPNNESLFMVRFSPITSGRRIGVLQIISNDNSNNIFSVVVDGIGL